MRSRISAATSSSEALGGSRALGFDIEREDNSSIGQEIMLRKSQDDGG